MPIYVYKCPECASIIEVYRSLSHFNSPLVCPMCDFPMRRIIVGACVHIFKPGWWEDIDVKPIYIDSKQKLIKECKKRNLIAPGWM